MTEVEYGNDVTATYGVNELGKQVAVSYAAGASNLLSYSQALSVDNRTLSRTSTSSSQDFTFDGLDRLTKTEDRAFSGCNVRVYQFNLASERTDRRKYAPSVGGECQDSVPSASRTLSYDAADRIISAGYSYDSLGRTTQVPEVDTSAGAAGPLAIEYKANDMAGTLTQLRENGTGTETASVSYGRDPENRVVATTRKVNGAEVERTEYRYADTTDSPSRIRTSVDGGTSWSSADNVILPGIGLAATSTDGVVSYHLSNLQGDIVGASSSSNSLVKFAESDEYGNQTAVRRYGWLGVHSRSGDSVGGLYLMGARLYNPSTGRFTSLDPYIDGNATAYGYPTDPVNETDLTGCYKCGKRQLWTRVISWHLFYGDWITSWKYAFKVYAWASLIRDTLKTWKLEPRLDPVKYQYKYDYGTFVDVSCRYGKVYRITTYRKYLWTRGQFAIKIGYGFFEKTLKTFWVPQYRGWPETWKPQKYELIQG